MLDLSIRPKEFIGMRFYSWFWNKWLTIVDLKHPDCPSRMGADTDDWLGKRLPKYLIQPFKNPDSKFLSLSGEHGCPIDPKNEDWKWEVGDRFWILNTSWRLYEVVEIVGFHNLRLQGIAENGELNCVWASINAKIGGPHVVHLPKNSTAKIDFAQYPKTCPGCGAPAYIGLNQIDCSKKCGV